MKTIEGFLKNSLTRPAPRIECWQPSKRSQNGIGLIVFPGGGYEGLAQYEGRDYAEYFSGKGLVCFVVEYRLGSQGHHHPAMIEDALAAIHVVRCRAREFGIAPNKIGVIGSSAGGHLAAHTLVGYARHPNSVTLRPDFGILCYPVITMIGRHAHQGSRLNLLGKHTTSRLRRAASCELHVKAQTPPCFIWHTWEDAVAPVENSLLFASALRKHGIPFELHIYEKGRHGLALGTDHAWACDCLKWLKRFIAPRISLPPR